MGTIWNAWETQWSGIVSREVRIVGRGRDFGLGFGLAQRTITNTRSEQVRTGTRTRDRTI